MSNIIGIALGTTVIILCIYLVVWVGFELFIYIRGKLRGYW